MLRGIAANEATQRGAKGGANHERRRNINKSLLSGLTPASS